MIELSVALPLFRTKYIGWLALESLCRQEGIDFGWELIIDEEEEESIGKQEIEKYGDRLDVVGCRKITYVGRKTRIPLGLKMTQLVQRCDKGSRAIAFSAGDYYCPPKRLATQYSAFVENPNIHWFRSAKTIFYDIETKNSVLYDTSKKATQSDTSGKFIPLHLARRIPPTNAARGIDGYFWKTVCGLCGGVKKVNVFNDKTDNWKYGFNTHGLNNLSGAERKIWFLGAVKNPYVLANPIDLKTTIPKDILMKIEDAQKYIQFHAKGK